MKRNKIYLGDSYELIKKIPDKSIDLIYVDIPYLIGDGGVRTNKGSKLSQRIAKIHSEDIVDIISGIDYSIFNEFKRVMKKTNIFIWCSKLQIIDILNWWGGSLDVNFEILTWNKTNPTPATNNTWLPDIEYCLYFRESGVRLNDGYDLKSKWYISPINKGDKDLYNHPTIKPLELVKRHIEHATQEGDLVLDAFLGSGTTAVACKQANRDYIGFEIEEAYFNIAQDRLKGFTQIDRAKKDAGQIDIFDFIGDEDESN